MMGQHSRSESLFYYFRIEDQVPENHLLRLIDRHVSFDFVREKLKDSYSDTGRPSIDPELLLRILLIGYLYGVTSERKLVEELQMHLAWRWFTGLSFDQEIPHHSTFSKNRHGRFQESNLKTRYRPRIRIRRMRPRAIVRRNWGLSSVGSRHPDKVAGLIYLEAAYCYAYYDRAQGDLLLDALELRKKLEQFVPGKGPQDQKQLVAELLQTALPQFEKDLQEQQKALQSMPPRTGPADDVPPAVQAILAGEQEFTNVPVPILAIFANPHDLGSRFKDDPAARSAAEARDVAYTGTQARAVQTGLPSSRVVQLPNADHSVFQSNERDVLREMNAFLSSLPSVPVR